MSIGRLERVTNAGPEVIYDAESEDGAVSLSPTVTGTQWPAPLADEALCGPAGQFVNAVAPFTEADPAGILISTLVLFGNAVGRSRFLRTGPDMQTPNVNAILVGPSGSAGRKGTATSTAKHLFKRCDSFSDWTQNCLQSGLSSGEGLIWAVRDPIYKRGAKTEESAEKPLLIDAGIEDKRVVFLETEFSSVLKVAAREGNTLSGVVRQVFDSGDLRLCTKNSPGQATGAHVSILGHVTANELHRFMSTTEMGNGFANRFLWVCVRRSKCLPDGEAIPDTVLQPVARRFEDALSFASAEGEMRRDESAIGIWRNIYRELTRERVGLLGAILGRADVLVLRLSMIYALLDCSPLIRPPHLEAAIAVWECCEASVKHIFGDRIGDPDADLVLSELRRRPEGLDRTEISALLGRNRSASAIDRILSVLLKDNLACHYEEKTAGRSRDMWRASLIS